MREYDVTPKQQGSECKHQARCEYYKYGIWCNICKYYEEYEEYEEYYEEDEEIEY